MLCTHATIAPSTRVHELPNQNQWHKFVEITAIRSLTGLWTVQWRIWGALRPINSCFLSSILMCLCRTIAIFFLLGYRFAQLNERVCRDVAAGYSIRDARPNRKMYLFTFYFVLFSVVLLGSISSICFFYRWAAFLEKQFRFFRINHGKYWLEFFYQFQSDGWGISNMCQNLIYLSN